MRKLQLRAVDGSGVDLGPVKVVDLDPSKAHLFVLVCSKPTTTQMREAAQARMEETFADAPNGSKIVVLSDSFATFDVYEMPAE